MEESESQTVRIFHQLAAVLRAMRRWAQRHPLLTACLALLLFAYVGSYFRLSRRGFAEAERSGMSGFHYFTAEHTDEWRLKQHACAVLFAPLNKIDCCFGTGMPVAHEPLWSLE
jgi:hypothetical protein